MALRTKRTLAGITIAILLAIGVVAVGLTFFPRTGEVGVGPGGSLVQLGGKILANSSTGAGVVNVVVKNAANYPIAGIALVGLSPILPDIINNVTFVYNGEQVTISNPLPIGEMANGTGEFSSGGQVGTNHAVTVATTLANGQVLTQNANYTVGDLTTGTSAGSIVVIVTIDVPTVSGNGTLSIQVLNNGPGNSSITSLQFTNEVTGSSGTPIPTNVSGLVLTYQGNAVSSANPLPYRATAAGSIEVNDVKAGTSYSITIIATFQNGYNYHETAGNTAQI
jgi:hypothetical protein